MDRRTSRRRFLLAGGATVLIACSDSSDSASPSTEESAPSTPESTGTVADASSGSTTLTAADFDALAICTMLPESTAGPFPTITPLIRQDITEAYPGHALRLGLRAVDGSCRPIPGTTIEVWHTDASGDYSSYSDGGTGKDEATGTTFLRGTQIAGDDGIVEFRTIVPGWYPGRAVHIHVRAHVDGRIVYTGQLYFDDAWLETIYAAAPYSEFGLPSTTAVEDGIAGDPATDGTRITISDLGDGALGLVNLGVG